MRLLPIVVTIAGLAAAAPAMAAPQYTVVKQQPHRTVVVEHGRVVDVLAAGCDAGIRYDERLEQDMIAVPIGPDERMVAIASE